MRELPSLPDDGESKTEYPCRPRIDNARVRIVDSRKVLVWEREPCEAYVVLPNRTKSMGASA